MRYYAKTGITFWLAMVSSCFWVAVGLGASNHHRHLWMLLSASYLLIGIRTLCVQLFSYWEIRSDGLFERRIRTFRFIPLGEVTRFGPALAGDRTISGRVNVQFARPAPMSERDTLPLTLAHDRQFLADLRRATPHSNFVSF